MTVFRESSSKRVTIGIGGIQAYQVFDRLSGCVLLLMLVAAPWLFGTTQPPTILAMNTAGWFGGGLLLAKWIIRRTTGYQPQRWFGGTSGMSTSTIWVVGGLTVMVLSYMLISLLNPRATWDATQQSLVYSDTFFSWLPHSLERNSTQNLLLNYTALAGFFWALWDWLMGLSPDEQRRRANMTNHSLARRQLPKRLNLLLWMVCINGACLAIEGITQRLTNTDRLLWLVQPTVFKSAEAHFGPFAYRANGAQYLNLIWPVALGFWWTLHRTSPRSRWLHHLLLPAITVMAAGPFIATTRAGAIISGLQMVLCLVFLAGASLLVPSSTRKSWSQRIITGFVVLSVFGSGLWMAQKWGSTALERRMVDLDSGLAGRENLNAVGRKIAADYRWFGTGPGTLVAVYPLYRDDPEDYWPAQLHNDWLETRITFGRIGTVSILVALGFVLAKWWRGGGIYANARLVGCIWIALGGVLLHARFDFPFQIYSILLTVLALCAVLLSVTSQRS